MIVDFHAEVTSEKVAMGWHLDGRVAAVLGTHTHVPTADGRVLPGGTAFISDVGMTGSRTSVLGVKPEQALRSLITQMPTRFETAEEDVWVMGALVEVNDRGLADSFEQVMLAKRDEQQRVEPDDVEVEPVVQGQLEQDQQGGRERGELDQGIRRGMKAKSERREAGEARIAMRSGSSEVCPQMLKGESRPAWVAMVRS